MARMRYHPRVMGGMTTSPRRPAFHCILHAGVAAALLMLVPLLTAPAQTSGVPVRENLGPHINTEQDEVLPVISPDGSLLVTVGRGVPPRPLVNRVHVLSRGPSGDFRMEWDFELALWARADGPLTWGPVNPRWVTTTSITFDRVDAQGRLVGTAVATRDDRGWHFAVVK